MLFLLTTPLTTPLAATASPAILIFGDSLSAGHGIALDQSWPALLTKRLEDKRLPYRVVNASISGETTEGGKARLPQLLAEYRPRIVVLELGGNDGLRGFAPAVIHANLAQMIADARHAGAKVLLLGMRIPPNYGPRYTTAFHAIYGTLAEQTTSALVPFLLEGIAINRELMQEDGIHPNAAAQPLILANVLPALSALLRD